MEMLMMMRKLAILAMLVVGAFVGSKGQSLCNAPVSGIMACQPAVTGAHPPKPTEACCSTLAKANLSCLCSYKSVLANYGVDPKKAMQLPAKCNLTPPAHC